MTSNKIAQLLSASVLTAVLCTTPAMAASVTATENVRVRSGAGTSYSVISMLYKGDSATKLSSSGGWVKVKVGSKTGYVSADFVTSKTSSSSSSTKTRYCTASSLNVRSKASTSASVIGSLS
ncbi:MAG: SH3 domain-containing protein, partial [Butyricicoccus sp.]